MGVTNHLLNGMILQVAGNSAKFCTLFGMVSEHLLGKVTNPTMGDQKVTVIESPGSYILSSKSKTPPDPKQKSLKEQLATLQLPIFFDPYHAILAWTLPWGFGTPVFPRSKRAHVIKN